MLISKAKFLSLLRALERNECSVETLGRHEFVSLVLLSEHILKGCSIAPWTWDECPPDCSAFIEEDSLTGDYWGIVLIPAPDTSLANLFRLLHSAFDATRIYAPEWIIAATPRSIEPRLKSALDIHFQTLGQHALEFLDGTDLLWRARSFNRRQELLEQTLSFCNFEAVTKLIIEEGELIDASSLPSEMLQSRHRDALAQVDFLPFSLFNLLCEDPRHVHKFSPRGFERFIAELLAQIGFAHVVLTPRSNDRGRDVIASLSVNNIPLTFFFECKRYSSDRRVQLSELRSLLGALNQRANDANVAVLVTTATFTRGCRELAIADARLDCKDYHDLLTWLGYISRDERSQFGVAPNPRPAADVWRRR
jgi:hypothetical protein